MPPVGEHLFVLCVGVLSAAVVVVSATATAVEENKSGDDNPDPLTVEYVAKARSHIEYPFVVWKLKERLPLLLSYYVDTGRMVTKKSGKCQMIKPEEVVCLTHAGGGYTCLGAARGAFDYYAVVVDFHLVAAAILATAFDLARLG